MATITVIACDPGASGSFCCLNLDSQKQPEIHFIDNSEPIIILDNWIKDQITAYPIRMAMIEDVHSIFGMSAKSNFSFGRNLGTVTTLLTLQSRNFGLDLVQPKIWQKYAGVKKKGKEIKKEVAEIAERLYPGCDIRGPEGGLLDGRSDALLIAHFCAHKYK